MPQVPYTGVPGVEPSLERSPQLYVNAPPAAFGTTIAGAIDHLGTTLDQVGNEMTNRALAMAQLRNSSEAVEASAQHELQVNNAYVDFESKKGKNAVDAFPAFQQGLDKIRTDIRDSLSNDMVRKDFDARALSTQNRALFGAGRHMAGENLSYSIQAARAGVDAAKDTARYAQSDEDFQAQLKDIEAHDNYTADQGGMDDATRSQLIFKDKSDAYSRRIINTAHTDPLKAWKMFQDAVFDQKLHSQDYDRTRDKVETELRTTGARSISQQTWGDVTDPEGYLQKRAQPGVRIEGVDPEFAKRAQALTDALERATGGRSLTIESMVRTPEEQAAIRARNLLRPGGLIAHPTALPETSRHVNGHDAMDVDTSDPIVMKFLHEHADEFGLEFLPGKTGINDPGHIQMKRGVPPERTLPAYEVSETQLADHARYLAEQQAPGNQVFADAAVAHTLGVYHQNRQVEEQANQKAWNTIDDALLQLPVPQRPHTIDDLRTLSPEINSAYESLSPRHQIQLEKRLAQIPRMHDDLGERARIMGLMKSQDSADTEQFLKEDIPNNPKLSEGTKKFFGDKQVAIGNQPEKDPKVAHAMSVLFGDGVIDSTTAKDKDQINLIRGTMHDLIQNYTLSHKDKYPTDEEIKVMGRRLLNYSGEGRSFSQIWGQEEAGGRGDLIAGPLAVWEYLREPGRTRLIDMDIPPEDEERIKADPQWALEGLQPNAQQIKQYYLLEQYSKLYSKAKP